MSITNIALRSFVAGTVLAMLLSARLAVFRTDRPVPGWPLAAPYWIIWHLLNRSNYREGARGWLIALRLVLLANLAFLILWVSTSG